MLPVRNLPQQAIDAFCARDVQLALADEPPAIWLLFRFGEVMPWRYAPFNIHKLPEPLRPDPVFFTKPEHCFGFYLHVLDADTGIVRGLRMLQLTPVFSRKLAELIQSQHLAEWKGQEEYERGIAEVRNRLPTGEAMLERAVCRMSSVLKGNVAIVRDGKPIRSMTGDSELR